MTKMTTFSYEKLEQFDSDAVENCINAMDQTELLLQLNEARRIAMQAGHTMTEAQNRAAMLIARKLRSLRETGVRTTRASKKAPAAAPSLDDLAADLGL